MPRKARPLSQTGIYHIVTRGVGMQIIFEDDVDFFKYLKIVEETISEETVSLLAWCLMSNHVHLLTYAPCSPSVMMHRINTRYARFYNQRHDRVGYLFQDRFRSEAVESERYLKTVVRYIHQNPVKAGLVCACAEYKWSSYLEYLTAGKICETSMILGAFGGVEQFEEFHLSSEDDKSQKTPLEASPIRLTDGEAVLQISKKYGSHFLRDIKTMSLADRNKALRNIKREGLSIRQLARLTGLGTNIIRGA